MRGCSGFVRWKGWVAGSSPTPIVTSGSKLEEKAVSYLKQLRQNDWAASKAMIAVLHDPARNELVRGQCGTSRQKDRGAIPLAVWNAIPDEWDTKEMRYGRNCAEVNALRALYNTHPPASPDDLRNYKFVAMDTSRTVRGPCAGCRTWLRHFHIQAYFNGAWQVP